MKKHAFTLAEVMKKFPPFLGRVRVGMKQYPSQPPLIRGGALAFTLTEVLITLGVIGVVSAMTLPSVIKNYQKHKTVNQLKKVYTVLNQAFRMSEIDNGDYEHWNKIAEIGKTEYVNKYWKPYLKVLKTCNNYTECGYSESTPWMNAINSRKNGNIIPNNSLILSDGTLIIFKDNSRNILVDLNSYSAPNRFGHDLFQFNIYKEEIKPAGLDGYACEGFCNKTKDTSDNGEWCAGKIVQDGWKIKDDYPW